jgi:putative transcriptional regulator
LEKKGNQEIENWLRYLLSDNSDFEFLAAEIDGKHVEILRIAKAVGRPVKFMKIDYIKSGTYTKKLSEFPALETRLWDKLRQGHFEDLYAKTDLLFQEVLGLLDCEKYFAMANINLPSSLEGYIHYLSEDSIVTKQDNGLYAVTNLGALLFARKLSDFSRLGRKAMRIVSYDGTSRLTIQKEETLNEGYALCFENLVMLVNTILPSKEDIDNARSVLKSTFPLPAIREAIANSMIHQDLYITGTGPVVEIFSNRVEVTNPGTPLIDIMRIVDNPPKSRNEKLASLMRRMKICEELGRGWDRMVLSCEVQLLPAPRIHIYQESTKVVLFSSLAFANISAEDKVWSTYLHACLKYIEGDALTNTSLRERFGLKITSSGQISRLSKDVVSKGLLKPLDPKTAPRYMRYVPTWG